jgi:hypothetical protein
MVAAFHLHAHGVDVVFQVPINTASRGWIVDRGAPDRSVVHELPIQLSLGGFPRQTAQLFAD